ncbi:MAG: hypothetical protein GF330_11960 [Candidatus Eisenbacteria bacterium]|nr:hypothetical protein [Candidatus Eisenbacteria bacterium]
MQRNSRVLFALALVAAAVLSGTACFDQDQARTQVTITRVADPQWPDTLASGPYLSDVLDPGPDGIPNTMDDIVYEDEALLTVTSNAPSDLQVIKPNGPYARVTLERYRVDFEIPGEQIEPIEGSMHLVVPSGSRATGSIVLVTGFAKTQPPLSTLAGGGDELTGTARITVHGTEETSGDEIVAEASIAVHFADWVQ